MRGGILAGALPVLILEKLLGLFGLSKQADVDVEKVVGLLNAARKSVDLSSAAAQHPLEGFKDIVHSAQFG